MFSRENGFENIFENSGRRESFPTPNLQQLKGLELGQAKIDKDNLLLPMLQV